MASNYQWNRPFCSQRHQQNQQQQFPLLPLQHGNRQQNTPGAGECSQPRQTQRDIPTSAYMIRSQMTNPLPDGSTIFTLHNYPNEAFTALNQFRQDGSLCDVTLHIKGEQIQAHKIVLASCSLYFKGMFTRGMREANESDVEIREPDLSAETLRTLVDFAYKYELHVTQHNVQSLLIAAIFLEMRHVIEACTLYMEDQLEPSNCIGFAHFASIHGCLDLEAKARKYIYEHFCEVIKYDEFLTLDATDMVNIVQQDALDIKCEKEVFQAVVRWVEHDSDKRMSQLEDLLEKVRLSSLAPCFLEDQLEKCHIIKQLPRCVQLLLTRLRNLALHNACPDKPRKPCKPLVIYSVGGFCRKVMVSLKCFECYDPQSKEWTRLPNLPSPRCGPGVTSLQGLVYVVGGRIMKCGQNVDSCSLDAYDPEENMWTSRCNMGVARNRVGVGVLDNMIYAIGGSAGGDQHKSAERYDPDTDSWEYISNMSSVRMSAGVAVLNRLLYVVGGFDGKQRLSSVECFHPERNVWITIEPMNEPRSGAGVTVLNGCIYAVGGYDGINQLTSVEKYDPQKKGWERVAPLCKARSGVGVAVIDNKLYALGGYDGSDFLHCVESYNPDMDTWESETVMLCARSGHGVTVERKPTVS